MPGSGMLGDMRISYAKFLTLLEAKRISVLRKWRTFIDVAAQGLWLACN